MKRSYIILLFCTLTYSFAQQTSILKIKKYSIATLEDAIQETSTLDFSDGKLYTINDSGNTPDIFEIDKNDGKILKKLQTKLVNKDWEAMCNDAQYFYIGDFGNNVGTRKDLKIYKIPKTYFEAESENIIKDSVSVISFYYPEQTDFAPKNIANDFDAEAMIFLNGKIHLFTKEWVSKSTTHYTIDPTISQLQPAQKLETFKTNFVVTDADYNNGKLYLIGYTKGTEVYLMIFDKMENDQFFKTENQKFYLGNAFSIGQIEGIASDEDFLYISGEAFHSPLGTKKQTLYKIPLEKLKPE